MNMNEIGTTIPFWDLLFSQQKLARDATVALLSSEERAQVLMACGTGKTRVGPAIAHALTSRATVIYVPSLALVRQTLPEWMCSDFGRPQTFLCVCSDETVQGDATVVTPDELREQFGFAVNTVTTSPDVIRSFLAAPSTAMKTVFCTYQSADTLAAGVPDGFLFDLGIFDEAHRTAGKQGMFTGPLQDAHTPIAKRVFMTATPKHVSMRKSNKNGEGSVVYSMDDEATYGKVAYRLPIREAIDGKLIADYKVLVSVVDDSMLPEAWRQKIGRGETDMAEVEAVAHAIALDNAMQKYGLKKAVTFHNTVAEASDFVSNASIRDVVGPDVAMLHINGTMASSLRAHQMDSFLSAPAAIVTNARCLTEGVDAPSIDLVAFLHPRKSHVDIIQAIGRALRMPRGSQKTTGYILLPLYVSNLDNGGLGAALEESGYDTIYQVIQALREQDEKIESYLMNAVWRSKEKPIDLPFIEFAGPALHLDMLRNAISVACIEAVVESWETYYGVLLRMFEAGEDVNVLHRMVIDGLMIGTWCGTQRQAYKAGKLSPERAAKLESVGFVWDQIDASWNENFGVLATRHKDGLDVNLPQGMVVNGLRIGNWCSHQRGAYKAGKLSPEHAAKLESVSFVWCPLDVSWNENFGILAARHKAGLDVNVPQRMVVDGLMIGNWCGIQRRAYKAGKLSPERAAKLESVGFVWDQIDASWNENFGVLATRHKDGLDVNVPQGMIVDGLNVGAWCNTQRQAYKAGKLSPEHAAKLESVSFVWCPLDVSWNENFGILAARHKAGLDVNVPHRMVVDGLNVGAWCSTQRKAYKAGKLPPEHAAKLESVGFVWDQIDASWNENFGVLATRHKDGLDVNVPQGMIVDGLNVGAWCSNQRKAYKAGKLPPEHAAKLESVSFVWDPFDASWNENFDILAARHKAGLDVNVPQRMVIDGVRIGIWRNTQRKSYKAGKLSADRIAKLEAIGFRWSKP